MNLSPVSHLGDKRKIIELFVGSHIRKVAKTVESGPVALAYWMRFRVESPQAVVYSSTIISARL